MVGIQVLQLSAQRRQCGRLSIGLPQRVVLLSVNWSAALSAVVFPDSKPRLKERTVELVQRKRARQKVDVALDATPLRGRPAVRFGKLRRAVARTLLGENRYARARLHGSAAGHAG